MPRVVGTNSRSTSALIQCPSGRTTVIPSGVNVDMPYRFLDAYVAECAYRMARNHKQELEQVRKTDAEEAWQIAGGNDVENVSMVFAPTIGQYYR